MARTQKAQAATPKAPDFIAWHVQRRGEKAFWNRVGASFPHKDGKGSTLQLDTIPIDGRVVLRPPMPAKEA